MCVEISVIIPTYNRGKIIPRTLDSVRNQFFVNWECIIVDDGSTDTTKTVINSYIETDNRFSYLPNYRKKGAQGARNTGIVRSRGKYVVLFDSDNIMHPDFLLKVHDMIEKENVDVCGSFSNIVDAMSGETIGLFDWVGYGVICNNLMRGKCYFDNSSTLIKKQKLYEIGLLDEDCPSYQEWDTHIRLSKISTYTTIEEPLVDYFRGGADTISASKVKDIKGLLFILNKYRKEWMFKYPMAYLRKLYEVYVNLKSIQYDKEYSKLSELYRHDTNCMWQLIVWGLYIIKNK